MDKQLWTAVDQYTTELLLPPDPILDAALAASEAAGLPSISVSPSQGKLLMLLAQMVGASRILEIGTLGGYSSIWLARALGTAGRMIRATLDTNIFVSAFNFGGLAGQIIDRFESEEFVICIPDRHRCQTSEIRRFKKISE